MVKYHLPANCSTVYFLLSRGLVLIMYQVENNVNLFLHVLGKEREQNKMPAEMMFWGLLSRVLYFFCETSQNFAKKNFSILVNSGNY